MDIFALLSFGLAFMAGAFYAADLNGFGMAAILFCLLCIVASFFSSVCDGILGIVLSIITYAVGYWLVNANR